MIGISLKKMRFLCKIVVFDLTLKQDLIFGLNGHQGYYSHIPIRLFLIKGTPIILQFCERWAESELKMDTKCGLIVGITVKNNYFEHLSRLASFQFFVSRVYFFIFNKIIDRLTSKIGAESAPEYLTLPRGRTPLYPRNDSVLNSRRN